MTDPLGLLTNRHITDPLGLLPGERPVPELRALRPGWEDDEGWEGFQSPLWGLFTDKPAERAKAANAAAVSSMTGVPASVAYEHMDEISGQLGLRDQPTFRELIEKTMMGAVVAGLVTHPLATVVGVTTFGLLAEGENYLISRHKDEEYRFGAGKGLAELLPEDSDQRLKDLVWTADMAWKAVAVGGAIKTSRSAAEKFAMQYMRDVTETYSLPRTVFVSPEKIRAHFGGGGSEPSQPGYVRISPEEAALLKDLGLSNGQYRAALRDGIDIEIPAERIVTIVDKPWWAAMKEFFKASPYQETVVTGGGKPTGKRPVAAMIEGAPRREFADILKDFNNVIGGERGSFSTRDMTPEKAAAMERLRADMAAFKEKARETGKDMATVLKEFGFDEATVTSMLSIDALQEPPVRLPGQGDVDATGIKPAQGQTGGEIVEPEPSLNEINELFSAAARTDQAQIPPPATEYDKVRAEAARIAFETISKRYDLARRRSERELKRSATEEAKLLPVYQAMQEAIRLGGISHEKLSRQYDADTVTEIARKRIGLVTKASKYGLDEIADITGFESDEALMSALLDWEGLGKAAEKIAAQYEEHYGELISEAELETFHIELLSEEIKILGKLLGEKKRPSAPGIKKVIREKTGQTPVGELTVSAYQALKAGMRKAEIASRQAFRAGNIEGTLAEKERQLELATARREKLLAKEEAKKIHDGLLELSKNRSIPEEYQDRIADLLEDFDLLPRSNRTAKRVESAREFLERQKAAGEDVSIPESMLSRIERYGKVHWRDLTLEQLREIYNQARIYAHLGQLKNKLVRAQEKRAFEDVVETIVSAIDKNWGVKSATAAELENMFSDPTLAERLAGQKEGYLASLTKVETYLRRMDGFKDLGPVWDQIYSPVKAASDVEYRRLQDITRELQGLFDPVKTTLTKEKFKIPGVPQFLTREKVIMVALNSGNEGNLAALKENKVYGWDDSHIAAILANVTPEEWALVRGIWGMFEKQFPDLAAVYKNLTGTTLAKVEGDYFPLVFDRKLSWIADRNATEKELRDFFQSIYTLPAVKSGSTIERIGGRLPPKLSFQVIFDKLAEVNHYITHAEAVRDVQKILADNRVRAAVEGSPSGIGGPEAYREIMSWLQDVARQKADPLSPVEAAVKTARINTTAVAMAWKFSVAAVQFLGGFNSVYKLGAGEFAGAVAEFYTNREALVEKIKGMSAEASGRAKSFDREMRDAYHRIGLEHFYGSAAVKDTYFTMISMMDMAVAYPTWLAAYNKSMREVPGEEARAIEYADMMLRMTQGGALVKDLAGVQRGSELKKLVSMFYTFFSSFHQMMSDAWLKFKFDKTGENFADLMRAWWWMVILPPTIEYIIREKSVPSPGQFLEGVLQFRLAGYPVVRDIMGAALTDYDYQISPVARAGEVMGRTVKEAMKALDPEEEIEFDELLYHSMESAGYLVGLPTGQAAVTIQGLMDLWNGETSDLTRLLFRRPREDNE
jgi:hypothetical protein